MIKPSILTHYDCQIEVGIIFVVETIQNRSKNKQLMFKIPKLVGLTQYFPNLLINEQHQVFCLFVWFVNFNEEVDFVLKINQNFLLM